MNLEQTDSLRGSWGLILGASSGFGEATSLELARHGMNIFGVHLDRKATLANVERIKGEIQSAGCQALFFNMNAADAEQRQKALDRMQETLRQEKNGEGELRVFLHSLAFGTLKRYFEPDPGQALSPAQMNMTLEVMAHSLVYWVQELVARKMLRRGSRIFAMTSSGGQHVFPTYGAVSAAKAALESHIRQLALELSPVGITANAVRAGVTDTPALRKIPGHEQMVEFAQRRNPGGRLTTTRDVAAAIACLSLPGTQWMTGNVIGVDGGEDIIG